MSTVTPLEWFHSLNNFLTEFYDSQCKTVKVAIAARKKVDINAKNNSVKKVPSTIHKSSQNVGFKSKYKYNLFLFYF